MLNSVGAVVAFGRSPLIWVDIQGIIGACLHTRLAANASVIIEVDDTIRACEQGRGGADGGTR